MGAGPEPAMLPVAVAVDIGSRFVVVLGLALGHRVRPGAKD